MLRVATGDYVGYPQGDCTKQVELYTEPNTRLLVLATYYVLVQARYSLIHSSTSRTSYVLHCERLKLPEIQSGNAMLMLQVLCIAEHCTERHRAFTFDNADSDLS